MDNKEVDKSTIKKRKKGIIYLSSIPPYMNVTKIREVFSEYGTLGRVFLQLSDKEADKSKSKKRKVAKKFTEGWVEFEKKTVAKKVARHLNNKQVSSKKKSKHFDSIWNIIYLSGFKWIHLHERLAYEKAVRRQKLRVEITLAKKKTNYFTSNIKHKKQDQSNVESTALGSREQTSNGPIENDNGRKDFLKSLFI